jgi:hypothetical protein
VSLTLFKIVYGERRICLLRGTWPADARSCTALSLHGPETMHFMVLIRDRAVAVPRHACPIDATKSIPFL